MSWHFDMSQAFWFISWLPCTTVLSVEFALSLLRLVVRKGPLQGTLLRRIFLCASFLRRHKNMMKLIKISRGSSKFCKNLQIKYQKKIIKKHIAKVYIFRYQFYLARVTFSSNFFWNFQISYGPIAMAIAKKSKLFNNKSLISRL